jgi:hypothetical protein
LRWLELPLTSDGIAGCYAQVIDGLVADEPASSLPTLEGDVRLDTPERRREVAARTLAYAEALATG